MNTIADIMNRKEQFKEQRNYGILLGGIVGAFVKKVVNNKEKLVNEIEHYIYLNKMQMPISTKSEFVDDSLPDNF